MDASIRATRSLFDRETTLCWESGSSSFGVPPLTLPDDVQVHIQCYGSIGWATGASFGIALADLKRKTILITGEGSHQLTANEIGNMGRFGANPIILCLNNDGYMVERRWSQIQIGPTTIWQNGVMQMCRTLSDARLVYRACRNAGRARCRTESSPRKQIGAYSK